MGEEEEILEKIEKESGKDKNPLYNFIIISGIISVVGFVVSFIFLIQMGVYNYFTGRVVSGDVTPVYGVIIITVLFFIFSFRFFLWARDNVNK